MSAIKDYLRIIRDGIKNGDKIIEALIVSAKVKNGNINDEALAEIMKRKELCASCPFNSIIAKEQRGYEDPAPLKGVPHCILCRCRIQGNDTKEYCLSCNCGMQAWNERNPDKKPMELKWKAFEVKDDTIDIKNQQQ